jgi:hypothetical protein
MYYIDDRNLDKLRPEALAKELRVWLDFEMTGRSIGDAVAVINEMERRLLEALARAEKAERELAHIKSGGDPGKGDNVW